MRFTFTGFRQDGGCRVFAYEGIGEDRVKTRFSVRVDLALSRQFGIRLQELPLLCVTVLERRTGDERDLVFSGEAMAVAVEAAATEAAEVARAAAPKRRAKKEVVEEYDPYEGSPMPPPRYGSGW